MYNVTRFLLQINAVLLKVISTKFPLYTKLLSSTTILNICTILIKTLSEQKGLLSKTLKQSHKQQTFEQ